MRGGSLVGSAKPTRGDYAMSDEQVGVVALDNYFKNELPVKIPELRRKKIVRLRGVVVNVEVKDSVHKLAWLDGVSMPLDFTHWVALPALNTMIEAICTQGAVYYFVKWYQEIPESGYKLKSDLTLEDLALEVLASSPDERITADSLHTESNPCKLTEEIEKYVFAKMVEKKKEKPEFRILGAVLGSLGKKGVIVPVIDKRTGEATRIRSTRQKCHFRPQLIVYTWPYVQTV